MLTCTQCGEKYADSDIRWQCQCKGVLNLEFEADFPKEKILSRKPTMWRYREAIPIQGEENVLSFDEGFTPLLEIEIDKTKLLVKDDRLFPTGSFKDRGASVLMSHVKSLGVKTVVEDSSGNAGSAMAAYCGSHFGEVIIKDLNHLFWWRGFS